jgi:hypothetical protein
MYVEYNEKVVEVDRNGSFVYGEETYRPLMDDMFEECTDEGEEGTLIRELCPRGGIVVRPADAIHVRVAFWTC